MTTSGVTLLAVIVLLVGVAFSLPVPEEASHAVGSTQEISLSQLEQLASIEGLGDGQTPRGKRTIGPYREIFPELTRTPDEKLLTGSESRVREVRIPFEGFPDNFAAGFEPQAAEESDDQDPSASGGNNVVDPVADAEQTANVAEPSDDENRNKRTLNFGLSGSAGSGGGSGNFIFDIIRLFAGSGQTESSDEASNSASGSAGAAKSVEKDDAGVPGPITRLFVIANRGLSNLLQDLILRLAQTSERIVNFKARLITSII